MVATVNCRNLGNASAQKPEFGQFAMATMASTEVRGLIVAVATVESQPRSLVIVGTQAEPYIAIATRAGPAPPLDGVAVGL